MGLQKISIVGELGKSFSTVAQDPRIETRAEDFIWFTKNQRIKDPKEAKEKFKKSLGKWEVYRGLCLIPDSPEYKIITEQRVLQSKIASERGLKASLKKARKIGYLRGIKARLHQPGTEYNESGFVFSVSTYPEPQILPTVGHLIEANQAYLLRFNMPTFDLLGLTIADIREMKGLPKLIRHEGILFDASNPGTEMFVLHQTHISNLHYKTFQSRNEIMDFCKPYRERFLKS